MNKEIIKQIIIDTINVEEHLGQNLKKQCIEYIEELQQENKILRENAEHNDKVVDKVNWENLKLKKQLEEYKRLGFEHLNDKCNKLENQQKEFIDYMNKIIEDCNNYSKYIEKKLQELKSRSVGKTFIVNEIMKNEVSKKILKEILSKYQEIIEVKNER